MEKNRVRNAVKHVSDEHDLTFEADIQEEALWMIFRAIDNYKKLGFSPTDLMLKIEDWFYEHYVGI